MMDETRIADLAASLSGQLVQPRDPEYDTARRVYNGMIDRRPRLVVRCADAADVMAAVNFARDQGLLVAVRGGGHNGAGFGTCDDGLVIDLGRMKGIRVDPASRTVRVEAGCLHRELDHATHAFGLAVPAGIISTTGVAGLTLGGGHGYLTRKHGLTIDNLLEADVVLADGRLVTASPRQHEDLYWALRGGGGNFGVVTSFVFRAHPVDTVLAGPMLWDAADTTELMQWYREHEPRMPEEISGFFMIMKVPPAPLFPAPLHGQAVCGVMWCCTGDLDRAEAALRPVRELRPPIFEHVGRVPFPAVQRIFDPLLPPGMQWYWKGDFFTEVSDAAIAEHARFARTIPSNLSLMHLYPIDGAPNRVAPSETAFAHREAHYSMVIDGVDPEPARRDAIVAWARDYWQALHPHSLGAAYLNFMMDEGADRVRATFGENYERLASIKAIYDPGNLFRVNQNIKPKG